MRYGRRATTVSPIDAPRPNIDVDTLANRQDDIAKVRDRFAKRAFITLFACTTGVEAEYLAAWDHAFGVECRGFKGPTTACIEFRGQDRNWGGVIVVMNYRIVRRGSHAYRPVVPPKSKPCDFRVNSLGCLRLIVLRVPKNDERS